MAQDVNGNDLKVSDIVLIEAVIVSIHPNDGWDDLTVETVRSPVPDHAGGTKFRFSINEAQVERK